MGKMAQMYLLVLTTHFLGSLAVSTIDDPIAFKNATWLKCQNQENAPEDAMKDLYFFKSVEGLKDHKCVMKCIDEEYGIYQKDGTVSKEMKERAIKGLWKDPQVQEKLLKANEDCYDSVSLSSDPCQYCYDLINCFIQAMNKEGVTINQ